MMIPNNDAKNTHWTGFAASIPGGGHIPPRDPLSGCFRRNDITSTGSDRVRWSR